MFGKKRAKVEQMLESYQEALKVIVDRFREVAQHYVEHGNTDSLLEQANEVSRLEGRIDDIRREIEQVLYGRQLLPESRGDILGILEAVDRIPNVLETVLYILADEHLEPLPGFMRPEIDELLDINAESCRMVQEALRVLLNDPVKTGDVCRQIDAHESKSDGVERSLIRKVYRSELELARKHHLRDLVLRIGSISDRGENCADRMTIIAIKRNI